MILILYMFWTQREPTSLPVFLLFCDFCESFAIFLWLISLVLCSDTDLVADLRILGCFRSGDLLFPLYFVRYIIFRSAAADLRPMDEPLDTGSQDRDFLFQIYGIGWDLVESAILCCRSVLLRCDRGDLRLPHRRPVIGCKTNKVINH